MKRWFWVVLLACICIYLIPRTVQPEPELKLMHVLETMHIKPEKLVLHYGSHLPQMSEQETLLFLKPVEEAFHLHLIPSKKKEEGMVYVASGRVHSMDMRMKLLVDKDASKNPYLSLQIMGKHIFDKELLNSKKQLTQLLRINKRKPQFHFSVQGYQQTMDQEKTMKEALHLLQAREVESLKGRTVSVSAYSSLLGESIQTTGGKMNVQVATRVDKEAKKLMVTMGTPIITIEY